MRRPPPWPTRPRFVVALLVLAGLVVLGTAGYVLVEGWTLFDGLYMAVITITTVGFMEVHPRGIL